MRVLVTGGAGFIGSHLAAALLQAGHDTSVLDDLSTGRIENVPQAARLYQVDISQAPSVARVFTEETPEIVFHYAAQASVVKSIRDPADDARCNIVGSLNVMQEAVVHRIQHLVFASTGGAIYGDPERLPADEDHPARPLSPYGVAKLAVEQYLGMYSRIGGLSSTCLRYGNIFGPRQDPYGEAGVIAIFTGQVLRGEAPRIFGDGTQTRDFVYVDDAVGAALTAMRDRRNGIYNIGTGRQTSVLELVEAIAQVMGADLKPRFEPPRTGEVAHIALDASKARRDLGWSAKTELVEGIAHTLKWQRERRERSG
jgi:UDP-glucose 4-epimerase